MKSTEKQRAQAELQVRSAPLQQQRAAQAGAEQPPGSSVDVSFHSTDPGKFSQHLLEKMDFSSSLEYQMEEQKKSQESKCQMQSWRKRLCKHLVPPALSLNSPWPLGAENKPSSVKESPATEFSLENAGVGCDLFLRLQQSDNCTHLTLSQCWHRNISVVDSRKSRKKGSCCGCNTHWNWADTVLKSYLSM